MRRPRAGAPPRCGLPIPAARTPISKPAAGQIWATGDETSFPDHAAAGMLFPTTGMPFPATGTSSSPELSETQATLP
ncbi:hypothetical protein EJB05_46216, partial [Eragrostis curvula]